MYRRANVDSLLGKNQTQVEKIEKHRINDMLWSKTEEWHKRKGILDWFWAILIVIWQK